MNRQARKRTPEELLRQVQSEEREANRGTLKIFLGYASGVGKSHRMLDEGRRRRLRGQDVVVGAIQPTLPPDVREVLTQLEVVPSRSVAGKPVMDLDAILRRHPGVCIIDGLAYDNPPGSRHEKRWQDVEEILVAGTSVLTSLNLQYIEKHREQVEQITGKRVSTTVPVHFIHEADEIEIVDAPAEASTGTQSGTVPGHSQHQKLQALREIALLLAADVVDRQLTKYLELEGLQAHWGTHERILVCITPRSDASRIIESGQRNANRFHGELFVVYVRQPDLNTIDQEALDRNLQIAREADAHINVLEGENPVEAIVDFAQAQGITQIFIGHSRRENWRSRWFGDPVDRLIRSAQGIDIQVFRIQTAAMNKGRLKIYLGYAAGVGKTYQMLEEGQSLKAKGVDIVIGYFEPHGRADTIARTEGLESTSRRNVEYRGSTFEEMDLPAILARKPQSCLVDELPHSNVPGVENEKRWQDVLALLDAGIDVITTMNIQHLESLNDQMQQITGIRVRETIPDWIMKQADEVVMIDVTPRALLNRLERGVIYGQKKARAALQNFFREPTLVALREMALRQTAHEVDLRQPFPDGFGPGFGPTAELDAEQRSEERILIYVTSHPHTAALIRRARRVADFLQADCLAVAVRCAGESHDGDASLEKHRNFARNLHIEVEVLDASRVADAVVDFARSRNVTQIYVSSPDRQPWGAFWTRSIPQQIVRLARDMRVVIVSNRP